MIDSLTVINLKPKTKIEEISGEAFLLSTCQRTILLGLGHAPIKYVPNTDDVIKVFHGKSAYKFILETILGLHSNVLAEYEIVAQFKNAYQEYVKKIDRNGHLITILEKVFKDHKKIRTEHLSEIGQLSYAGIARKIIHNLSDNDQVLILGSGQLAIDLINLLKKKYEVHISARNTEVVSNLAFEHNIKVMPFKDFNTYKSYRYIVNTIGADEVILDQTFFSNWHNDHKLTSKKLFIDLGSPSVIQTDLDINQGVFRLEDIFRESLKLSREKMEKVESAKLAVHTLTEERQLKFSVSIPFGWEELQFA